MPIVLNVFLTIPMNYLSEVQEDQALVPEDTVVVDMKIKRFKCYYFLRIDKVGISPEDNALSNSYFESETNINPHCDSDSKSAEIQEEKYEDEHYLDKSRQSRDSELGIPLGAARAAKASFSSIKKAGYSRTRGPLRARKFLQLVFIYISSQRPGWNEDWPRHNHTWSGWI